MALGALLEASGAETNKLGTALSQLGAKKVPKMGPKQGPKAIQAENDEITKLEGRLTKFLDFSGPRVSL